MQTKLRKKLMPSLIVREAINAQKKLAPIFFLENSMLFNELEESVETGRKSNALFHIRGIITLSIREDVDLHRDFVRLIDLIKS